MNKHDGCVKQFIILSQAHYADACLTASERSRGIDEITFGFYHPGQGSTGEMTIHWHDLRAHHPPVPRLEAFDDSWSALSQFKDVIDKLAELDDTSPTVAQVAEVLTQCGFIDNTPRKEPHEKRRGESGQIGSAKAG